jgi:hypothetical protein
VADVKLNYYPWDPEFWWWMVIVVGLGVGYQLGGDSVVWALVGAGVAVGVVVLILWLIERLGV